MSADSLDYPLHHGAPGELGLGLRDRQRLERDRLRDEVLLRRPGRGFPSRRPSIGGVSVSASLMATGSVAGGQAGGGPELVVKALLEFAEPTSEGQLVRAVAVPWFEIAERMSRDPQWMYQIEPRAWEEIIAGAYEREGFDEVILTPRSADLGRDVIATRRGVGSIRIFDQVKASPVGMNIP